MTNKEVIEAITMIVNQNFRDWIQHPLHTEDISVL